MGLELKPWIVESQSVQALSWKNSFPEKLKAQ